MKAVFLLDPLTVRAIALTLTLSLLSSSQQPIPQLVDRTDAANLTVTTYSGGAEKNHILESTGNGVLVLDYDLDDYQDLYFVSAYCFHGHGKTEPHPSTLYRNLGDGTFVDVTEQAGVGAMVYGHGGCVGDVDSDGFPDIYVTAYGPNVLYRNNGDGTFSDITEPAGVGNPSWSIAATFFDADGDGDHDLFVGSYVETTWEQVHSARRTALWRGKVWGLYGPKGLPGAANTFYVNNGDGTFSDGTEASGLGEGADNYAMGVTSFDYDNDGDVDLFVANDSTPNCLYRNRGDGSFEEVGTESGCAYNANGATQGSMGVDFGDYDGDGWPDLVVTNFAHDWYALYRNLGGKLFLDDTFTAGLVVPSYVPLGWGTFFVDSRRRCRFGYFLFRTATSYPQVDDDPSLYESHHQSNQLFLNEAGKFREVTEEAGEGFSALYSSRGAARADLDNDGDLDIIVSNQDARPSYLENRTTSPNHWVLLDLVPMALGARVELRAGGTVQIRQVASGGSYASQNDLRLHFGLGAATQIDELVVTWPDGVRDVHRRLPPDRLYVIKRGIEPLAP